MLNYSNNNIFEKLETRVLRCMAKVKEAWYREAKIQKKRNFFTRNKYLKKIFKSIFFQPFYFT